MARHLVATELGCRLSGDGLEVEDVFLPISRRGALGWTILHRARELEGNVDVLLVEQGLGVRLAVLRALGASTPRIAMISYDPLPASGISGRLRLFDVEKRLRKFLYRKVDQIVLVSQGQANWLRGELSRQVGIDAIAMSIDRDTFYREREPTGDYLFMVNGALRDFPTLGRALSKLDKKPSKLVIAHRYPFTKKAAREIEDIKKSGMPVETVYRASGSSLRHLYEDCLAVVVPVIPSRQPAGLTAILEAMAMGCAIVGTRDPWIEEYCRDGKEALFAPPQDADALAAVIETAMTDSQWRCEARRAVSLRSDEFCFKKSKDELRKVLLHMKSDENKGN